MNTSVICPRATPRELAWPSVVAEFWLYGAVIGPGVVSGNREAEAMGVRGRRRLA